MIECISFKESGMSEKEWDNYVMSSDNGTLFQRQSFLSYHLDNTFSDASLVFRKKKRIIALFPATVVELDGERILSSHRGASWGGFVYKNPLVYKDVTSIVDCIIEFARQKQCNGIEIRLSPYIYQTVPSDYLPFVMQQKGFRYQRRELNSVIRLELIDNVLKSFKKSAREEIAKSKRYGIEVYSNKEDWASFYRMLSTFLASKNRRPTHSYDELILLKDRFPDDIDLWTAYQGETLVGGRCNWQVQPGIRLFFYCAYHPDFAASGIFTRLHYECIKSYKESACRYVDFGTSSANMVVNEGLIANKEHFAAYGIFRDTLIYNLNGEKCAG